MKFSRPLPIYGFLVKKSFIFLSFFLGLFCTPVTALAAPASSLVVLDSWVYPALDKITGLGLVESVLQGSRPYTRLEAARQVREARQMAKRSSALPVVAELLLRLEIEFSDVLAEIRGDSASSSYLKPVRQLRLTTIQQKGQPSSYPGTNARQFALNTNNYGIDYADGNNSELRLLGDARFGKFLQLEWQPLLLYSSDDDLDLLLLQGRAALSLGPFEVSVGRQSLWWGPGRHGSLILTSNAKPLDMVRITNPTPLRLPWILEYLGPFRFDVFWSKLEEDRHIPEPYFAGLRLSVKPLPWIELGASRTVLFGGKGQPDTEFSDFVTILGGKNLSGGKDTSNSLAAIDACIRLPFLWGAQLYGEIGGEDEANHFIANTAYLAGIYLPKIEPSGRLDLRMEYADLSRIDDNSPPWYHHRTYRSGYTYKGQFLGHHVGGTGEDLSAELQILLYRDLTTSVGYDFEKRGSDQSVQEVHKQSSVRLVWNFSKNIALELVYKQDFVDNWLFVEGDNRTTHLARLDLLSTW
jgi:hypothetical protein